MSDHVVVVEDDAELRDFVAEVLRSRGFQVTAFATADAASRPVLDDGVGDVVVSDLILPGMRGHQLLEEICGRRPELNVIIVTAFGSIDNAIELVKAGAYDYLAKPFGTEELLLTIDRALSESRLRREVAHLSREAPATPPGFIGMSRPMRQLYRVIQRAARSRSPVLISGESGTGKELVARAVHQGSDRRGFVALNCAALPDHLLESELFGHEKGAFTGADRDKTGLFEAAHQGTLFLDEIGELPPSLQPKLLRALEEGEIRRVGSTTTHNVDVRVIAATNRDLEREVRDGRFREDLFWRINVLPIHVPPLRERAADIPLLAEHFAELPITPDAMALLTAYPWPGNVRELRNALQRAAALTEGSQIQHRDLPPAVSTAGYAAAAITDASRRQLPLRELERLYILETLKRMGGNKSRTAEILGLDRKTLYRKLEEYDRPG